MRRTVFTAIVLCAAVSLHAFELIRGEMTDSHIYPSTLHRYAVSVPENYDGGEACLYVGLDGILCDAPRRIDSLIAAGAMPPTIGVYVEPGFVADSDGTVVRYNRSNEFDATDGRFAEFLETELLPHALSQKTESGIGLNVKKGGENAMIFGLSSGGIAAFTAAWHRPELFGKVFAGCGTFVPMRGGNDLQGLVRKSEPRAVRIFLEDGFNDSWNPLFGSWFEANAMLGTALEFAGYDCRFDWGEGVHSLRRSNAMFADVMKWMWRDYPSAPDCRTTGNATLAGYLEGSGDWEECDYVEFADSPVSAEYPDGSFTAEPVQGSNSLKQTLKDSSGNAYAAQEFYWLHNYRNRTLKIWGCEFDAEGNLWVLTDAGVQVCDQNGRVRAIFRLPSELTFTVNADQSLLPATGGLHIEPGEVLITVGDRSFRRRLNVEAATPGVRPASQGQA